MPSVEASGENLTCDVLVVGAGPTGMTAAVLLAARGLDVIVLERRLSTSEAPKAISLDDEALRSYQQAGIADDVLSIIVPGTGTRYYDADNRAVFQARAAVPYRQGYPFKNPFAQPDLERVLREALDRHPLVRLKFGYTVETLVQDANSATVQAQSGDGALSVTAQYVLGADGGRSAIRSILGIGMAGRSHSEVWLVTDMLNDPHTERYGMHHGMPQRPHVIVPGMHGRCRYEFLLHPGEGEAGEDPPYELIRDLVAPYRQLAPSEVERAVNYQFHSVNANAYRSGRAFLLGDAAHMMAPFAGQGLNSGLRDGANLAWKIAQVVDGTAPESILDSYESERSPHALATIRLSELLGRIVMTTSKRVAAYRDAAVARALATDQGRHFFEEMRYRPIAHYRDGLVASLGAEELVGISIGQPRVFETSSHRSLLLDDAVGNGWVLFGVGVDAADWDLVDSVSQLFLAGTFHIPLDDTMPQGLDGPEILLDLDGGLYREFEQYRGRFVLLRPDRFVAAAWVPEDTASVLDVCSDWVDVPVTVS